MWCVLWIAMASAHRTYPMGFGVHVLFSIFHRSLTPSRALSALAQWFRYAGYIPYVDDYSFNYAIFLFLIYCLSLKFIVWTCSVYAETLPWYCVICLFFGLCCPYFYFHAILSFLHFYVILWLFGIYDIYDCTVLISHVFRGWYVSDCRFHILSLSDDTAALWYWSISLSLQYFCWYQDVPIMRYPISSYIRLYDIRWSFVIFIIIHLYIYVYM